MYSRRRFGNVVVDGLALEQRVVEAAVERRDDQRVLQHVLVGGGVALPVVHDPVPPPADLRQRVPALDEADEDERLLQAEGPDVAHDGAALIVEDDRLERLLDDVEADLGRDGGRLAEVDPARVDAGVLHLHVGDYEHGGRADVAEVGARAELGVLGPVLDGGEAGVEGVDRLRGVVLVPEDEPRAVVDRGGRDVAREVGGAADDGVDLDLAGLVEDEVGLGVVAQHEGVAAGVDGVKVLGGAEIGREDQQRREQPESRNGRR